MAQLKIGETVWFRNYEYLQSDVPLIFDPGEPLIVIERERDGVVRCARTDCRGCADMKVTDTLFDEELE